jgi:hypothetical protein
MPSASCRLDYLDNLRILLCGLVILHHAAIAQGASGEWLLVDQAAEGVQGILLTLFCAVNQAFFMGGFFFLAGYFVPSSYDRRGPVRFAAVRLTRLGIPLLVYAFLIAPALRASMQVLAYGFDGSFAEAFVLQYQSLRGVSLGPLWFVESLLLFSLVYVILRAVFSRHSHAGGQPNSPSPRWTAILALGMLLGIISFLVRLAYPTGRELPWLNAQLGYYTQYVALFFVGTIARRRRWIETFPGTERRRWFWISMALVLVMPVFVALGGGTSGDVRVFFGGLTWQAAAYALWDQILGLAMLVWLVLLFRDRFCRSTPLTNELARGTYAAFLLHAPVLVLVTIAFLPLVVPSLPKFVLVGSIAVFGCFLLAAIVRRLPLARRVL